MNRPVATYRLQLHDEFTLADVARVAPHLRRLGVSHLYLSPVTQAAPASEHGYDVTDPTRISQELGGAAAMEHLARTLHALGMRVLLDIVPNHMAASAENAWWRDLLVNGPASVHVSMFDTPLSEGGAGPLVLPVLGAPLDAVLAGNELVIDELAGHPVLRYHEHWFPLPHPATPPERVTVEWLRTLPYELAMWRTVHEQVCYRRFFDIIGLVGVRVEDPAVFERTHAGILDWLGRGWIDGLRIDHIDGLRDPAAYLRRLAGATARATDGARCYTVVEKIVAADERLPADWETDGTTGYEFARVTTSFLLFPDGYRVLDALRARQTGESRSFEELVHACKLEMLDTLFPAELRDVGRRLAAAANLSVDRGTRVLRELTAALSVYRTYISGDGVPANDRNRVRAAQTAAQRHLSPADHPALDTLCRTILLEHTHASAQERERVLDAVARWQQLSGPAMAKGSEDTALYRWPALLAVNEVGGEPGMSLDAKQLHAFYRQRATAAPGAMNATSTHDSKRSEDVRARLLVLSERAEEWAAALERWLPLLRASGMAIAPRDELVLLQTVVGAWPLEGSPPPDFTHRVQAYMQKAAREAKQETSWLQPDEAYETALQLAVERLLGAGELHAVREELRAFAERMMLHGAVNSLAQLLLRCTAPGVPDTYQGTGRWRFDLVDPDNRRPVDFHELADFAADLDDLVARPDAEAVHHMMDSWRDGRIRQYVLMAALACRARCHAFTDSYEPLRITGARAGNAFAFRRSYSTGHVITIVPRWPVTLADAGQWPVGAAWQDTAVEVPATVSLRNVFDGTRPEPSDGRLRLADALALLPVGLFEDVGAT